MLSKNSVRRFDQSLSYHASSEARAVSSLTVYASSTAWGAFVTVIAAVSVAVLNAVVPPLVVVST